MSETTLVNLTILSQLALGERLRVRGQGRFWQLYAPRNDHVLRFRVPEMLVRWWDGSSRHSDFTAILDMYADATQTLDRLGLDRTPPARATERALVQRLRDSVHGLHMLERTYAADLTLVARVQRLVERINLVCGRYPEPPPPAPAAPAAPAAPTAPTAPRAPQACASAKDGEDGEDGEAAAPCAQGFSLNVDAPAFDA